MKPLHSFFGTIAVLFSLAPAMSWATEPVTGTLVQDANGTTATEAEPVVIQTSGKTPVIIETTEGAPPLVIQPDGRGHFTIINPGNVRIFGKGIPQCVAGGG